MSIKSRHLGIQQKLDQLWTMFYIIIMDFMHQSLHLMSSMLAMNDQILAEYYSDTQNTKYIYCPTSEFTVRPQNLLSDLRIYCPTSEFTVRPQSLLSDLRVLLYDLGFWNFKF